MDLTRRMVLLDDTAAALRMVRAELATVETEALVSELRQALTQRQDPPRVTAARDPRVRVA